MIFRFLMNALVFLFLVGAIYLVGHYLYFGLGLRDFVDPAIDYVKSI